MNYLKEINAFIDWLETNPLESSTQTLWFHLMGLANKSGWPEWFTVANLTLQAKVGVTENTLNKHRNYLVQKGRLDYRSQGKQKAGKYRIIPFTPYFSSNNEVNHEAKGEVNPPVNPAENDEVKGAALFKQNKTELNETEKENARNHLLGIYNSMKLDGGGAFGLDMVYSYIGVVEVAVIEMALKKSEKKHFNYFVSTINSWIKDGKTTLELLNPIPQPGAPPSYRQSGAGTGQRSRTGKPTMPVVEDKGDSKPMSPEEREQLREFARRMRDGTKG